MSDQDNDLILALIIYVGIVMIFTYELVIYLYN